MGIVYKAYDPLIERFVAIKTINLRVLSETERSEYAARFYQEAKAAGHLSHPNIVTIYSVEESDGVLYFTMEYIEGHSLTELIPADGLPLKTFFEHAIALDPGFGPYQVHPIEFAVARGDRADAEARVARYEEATQDERHDTEYEVAIPLMLGDSVEAAAAIQTSLGVDVGILGRIRTEFANHTDRNDRLVDLAWANRNRAGADHQWLLYLLGTEGRLSRADRLLDSLDVSAGNKGLAVGWYQATWQTARALPHAGIARPATCESPAVSLQCQMFVGWGLARGGDLRGGKESARILRGHAEGTDPTSFANEAAALVEGAVAVAEGRTEEARRLLGPLTRGTGNQGSLARTSLGEVEMAAGNTSEAVRYLQGNLEGDYLRMHATLLLARLHDQRGEADEARRYYRSFVTTTRRGDPDLPEIVEARAALERLGG